MKLGGFAVSTMLVFTALLVFQAYPAHATSGISIVTSGHTVCASQVSYCELDLTGLGFNDTVILGVWETQSGGNARSLQLNDSLTTPNPDPQRTGCNTVCLGAYVKDLVQSTSDYVMVLAHAYVYPGSGTDKIIARNQYTAAFYMAAIVTNEPVDTFNFTSYGGNSNNRYKACTACTSPSVPADSYGTNQLLVSWGIDNVIADLNTWTGTAGFTTLSGTGTAAIMEYQISAGPGNTNFPMTYGVSTTLRQMVNVYKPAVSQEIRFSFPTGASNILLQGKQNSAGVEVSALNTCDAQIFQSSPYSSGGSTYPMPSSGDIRYFAAPGCTIYVLTQGIISFDGVEGNARFYIANSSDVVSDKNAIGTVTYDNTGSAAIVTSCNGAAAGYCGVAEVKAYEQANVTTPSGLILTGLTGNVTNIRNNYAWFDMGKNFTAGGVYAPVFRPNNKSQTNVYQTATDIVPFELKANTTLTGITVGFGAGNTVNVDFTASKLNCTVYAPKASITSPNSVYDNGLSTSFIHNGEYTTFHGSSSWSVNFGLVGLGGNGFSIAYTATKIVTIQIVTKVTLPNATSTSQGVSRAVGFYAGYIVPPFLIVGLFIWAAKEKGKVSDPRVLTVLAMAGFWFVYWITLVPIIVPVAVSILGLLILVGGRYVVHKEPPD